MGGKAVKRLLFLVLAPMVSMAQLIPYPGLDTESLTQRVHISDMPDAPLRIKGGGYHTNGFTSSALWVTLTTNNIDTNTTLQVRVLYRYDSGYTHTNSYTYKTNDLATGFCYTVSTNDTFGAPAPKPDGVIELTPAIISWIAAIISVTAAIYVCSYYERR